MSASDFYKEFDGLTSVLKMFAYNLTQNFDDARDLYQETAYRAIKNREKFTAGTNFKAWLMTIMKNIFINDYRKKVRHNTMVDTTDNLFFINSGSTTIENEGGANIMMQELVQMIDDLEDGLRIPFLMHYQGFKYQEIADQLELPLGTVKSRIFFARKELKAKIADRYHVEEINGLLS
jgi:RNA polymerase sigma-70 factor (ECF subfamily)